MSALIECRALAKRYGRTRALDGVDLSLESGAPIALVGPNGAGKTTLFSVLCGFVRTSGGSARVLGEAAGSRALRGRLAALPQDASLAPAVAIRSQLAALARLQGMSRVQSAIDADRVLERVQLSDIARSAPEALSHGMRKRVAFAQALLGTPELILLDEPTAGVDPPNVRVIHELMRELTDSVDFLISSHNLDELERLTERVVYLENGRVSERSERAAADVDAGRLTITLDAGAEVSDAAGWLAALDGIDSCRVAARGELVLDVGDEDAAAVAVLAALVSRGVRWRRIARGRSLEARLYDE